MGTAQTDEPCTDPATGRRVFRWAAKSGTAAAGAVPSPSDEVGAHVAACPHCRRMMPIWQEKARAGDRLAIARQIVALGVARDARVLVHTLANGRAYFTPDVEGGEIGTRVLTDADGQITWIGSCSRAEFEAGTSR
jgi:hypothetical protein